MAKKKERLLSVGQDDKSLSGVSDDGIFPVTGSTSNDALLSKTGTSNSISVIDETCQQMTNGADNNNGEKFGKYENEFGLGFNGDHTPSDDHMRSSARRCPWRGMTMAVILLLFGSLLIIAGIALVSGVFHLKGLDNVTPYLILVFGTLCFIPGAYHILVACCAMRGHERFSFDDIPYFS